VAERSAGSSAGGLRVGVIGVGAMGAHHVRVYGELDGAQLVAIADSSQARLAEIAQPDSVRGYADYREMLAEERLDAVSIAVPTRQHIEVARACVEQGIPVLVEKPLAASLDECLRLNEAALSADVPLMVGHIERFNPGVVELKKRIEQGEAGSLVQIEARRVGPFFPRERDVGVVQDLATHDIDVLRHLVACDIDRVRAETRSGIRSPYEDALSAVLRFEDGTIGTLDVNWLSPVKDRELRVLGERGLFKLDYLTQQLTFYPTAVDAGVSPVSDRGIKIDVNTQEPLRVELDAFLRVVRGEDAPRVGADDAIAAMRVVEALVESAQRGEALALPVGDSA
jgi:predicted dehydrogenase